MRRLLALLVPVLALLALPASAQATFPGTNGRILYSSSPVSSAASTVPFSTILPTGRGATRILLRPRGVQYSGMRVAPNGANILFNEYVESSGRSNVVRTSSFGRSRTVLQTGVYPGAVPYFAAWSPLGQVWFARVVNNDTQLIGPNGPVTWMFATTLYECGCPEHFAVEPGGARVAFIREDRRIDTDGNSANSQELWIANADGTGDTKLTSFGGNSGFDEVWWGAGGYIYFRSMAPRAENDDSGRAYLYRIRPDGTDLARIASVRNASSLDVSPDGRWLLIHDIGGSAYVADRYGRNPRSIKGTNAVFSPDSRRIAYTRLLRSGNWPSGYPRFEGDVFTMAINGTNQVRVTRSMELHEQPIDWQSIAPR